MAESPVLCLLFSLDLETTGLSVFSDQITQIALVISILRENGEFTRLSEFESLVKPQKAISQIASDITGITDEMLANQPNFAKVLPMLVLHLETTCDKAKEIKGVDELTRRVLVAYNGRSYDVPLLIHELKRINVDFVEVFMERFCTDFFVDPLLMARVLLKPVKLNAYYKPSFKLTDVYEFVFGKELEGAHGALADAKACEEILLLSPLKIVLLEELKTNGQTKFLIQTRQMIEKFIVSPSSYLDQKSKRIKLG